MKLLLTWGDQITSSISKTSKILNLLRRNLRNCSQKKKKKSLASLSPTQCAKRAARWIFAVGQLHLV